MKMLVTPKMNTGEGVREGSSIASDCCLLLIHSLYLTKGVDTTGSLKPTDEILPPISLDKRMAKWMSQ